VSKLEEAQREFVASGLQASDALTDARSASARLAEATLAVMDPRSALVVAVRQLTAEVTSLRESGVDDVRLSNAETRLARLNEEISSQVVLSPAVVEAARTRLSEVLSDPTATIQQVVEARIALAEAVTPSLEVVTAILADPSIFGDSIVNPLLPVIVQGVVDEPRPNSVVMLDNGVQKSMQVVRITNTILRLTYSDGFSLAISSRDPAGRPIELGTNGAVRVRQGNIVSIAGEGFAGGTLAKTWIFSTPRELGELSVLSDGSFAEDYKLFDDIKPGLHTAQVNGIAPDGSTRSISMTIEVIPNEGPAPYDPLAKQSDVVQLIAELMTLMVVMRSRDDDDESDEHSDEERGSGDVNEIGAAGAVSVRALRTDRYRPVAIRMLDVWLSRVAVVLARSSRLVSRVVSDGVYVRSLLGVFGYLPIVAGAVLGLQVAQDSGNTALIPVFGLLLAIVVLGVFDALAGLVAVLVYAAVLAIGGDVNSADVVRGFLGLAVLWFGVPVVAALARPFQRESYGDDATWRRLSDMAVLAFVGAWGAGSMFGALPGLFGVTYASADRTLTVQLSVVVALFSRYLLEQMAAHLTPQRLSSLSPSALDSATTERKVIVSIAQTALFVFVAVVFVGNNWALWLGAALYITPKLVALVSPRFPKSRSLGAWLPSGVIRSVILLVVAVFWARWLDSAIDDASTMLKVGFVLLGLPGLVVTALSWFASRTPHRDSTALTKVGGVALVIFGALVVFGVVSL
jgi:hypothetical protein